MGEVYRATDSNLKRSVAIKMLPASVAGDADRIARFQREAEVLAALNHPNIAAIYGLEKTADLTALVMELVEGDDLSQLIARGPMAFSDALPIARQIAGALEAAHEQGIIHRDLKPANVKVRADGAVKVLDFGLAKAIGPEGASATADARNSPTLTARATQAGVILGTAAYMAPEQARGNPVDTRADIWAFGVVLYEMLTGRRAFAGNNVSELLAAVLRDTPDLAALPVDTPASVRRLLRRCLQKDPKQRLSAMGDARLELDETEVALPPTATTPVAAPRSRKAIGIVAVLALALAGLAAAAAWFAKPSTAPPVRLLELPAAVAASSDVALSPDGARLAYVLDGHLNVLSLDTLAVRDLGATTAARPFWSPDGTAVGFWAESEIRTVPAAGGPMFTVCKVPATGRAIAAKWLQDGTIAFAVWRENVYAVPAAGGTPVVAFAIDPATEIDIHHISEAPDGKLIILIHQRSNDRGVSMLVGRSPGAGQARVVLSTDQTIRSVDYVAPGFTIVDRQGTNAGLWAAPFTGGPIDLAKATLLKAGVRSAAVASDGSVVFEQPAVSRTSLVWIDRAGTVTSAAGAPVAGVQDPGLQEGGFALSPDGRRVAMVVGGEGLVALGQDQTALVVRDLSTGVDTPLTFRAAGGGTPANAFVWGPSWFPAGDRILLTSGEVENFRLMVQPSSAAATPRDFSAGLTQGKITRDGRTLAAIQDDRGRFHLLRAPVSAEGVPGTPQRVFEGDDPDVDEFDVSSDGRFVVYAARQIGGRHSLFLSEFPAGRGQWQLAEDAVKPLWSPDGREVFYVQYGTDARGQPTRTLTSRTVTTTPAVVLGAATPLFGGESATLIDQQGYSITPDGRRFLTMKAVPPAPGDGKRLLWMQNWPAALRQRK